MTVRKAVFSMMAMKRMSMLASQLSPQAQRLGDNIAQYKEESEKVRQSDVPGLFGLVSHDVSRPGKHRPRFGCHALPRRQRRHSHVAPSSSGIVVGFNVCQPAEVTMRTCSLSHRRLKGRKNDMYGLIWCRDEHYCISSVSRADVPLFPILSKLFCKCI
jgi:hypothetical protein